MHPSDDLFYARLLTLSDVALFKYIEHYADYRADAVYAALAELRTRGVYVSEDAVSEIERYFMRQEQQRMRAFTLEPHHLRWLAYVLCTLGLGIAMFLYATASPPPAQPLEYDPFTSKKYLYELERYGGKINILAVEFRQWCAKLWHGKPLAYTIAGLTMLLSSLLWYLGASAVDGE
jgi:hypothetical protein